MTRLSRLISLGLGSALALLGVNGIAFHFNTDRSAENQQRLTQSQAVLQKLQKTVSLLKDAETGQRGYLLTGKARYLEPYRGAIAPLNQRVRELRQLTQNHPQQQARMRKLEPTIDKKLAELQETIKLRQTQGLEGEKAALRLVQTDRGQQLMDSIRQQVTTLAAEENRQVAARSQALATAVHQTSLTFWVMDGLTLVLLALLWFWVWRDRVDRQQSAAELLQLSTNLEQQIVEPLGAIEDLTASGDLTHAELDSQPIDLIHIVEDSLRHLTDLLQERDAEVMVAHPLPIVRVDRSTLLQVVTNLIGNALKLMPPDRRPVVKIYSEQTPSWVCLWIEDNGSIVAPEYQDRSSLDRWHGDESDGGIGVGGLTIVRQTLQPIGGQVGVESLAQGSRFWIALPVRTAVCPHCDSSASKTT